MSAMQALKNNEERAHTAKDGLTFGALMKFKRQNFPDEDLVTVQMLDDQAVLVAEIRWVAGAAAHDRYALTIKYIQFKGKRIDVEVRDNTKCDLIELAETLLPILEHELAGAI